MDNDLAILKLNQPIDFTGIPHISPACMPDKYSDFTGAGKYQNILKEVDVPIIGHNQCQNQLS